MCSIYKGLRLTKAYLIKYNRVYDKLPSTKTSWYAYLGISYLNMV
jgi:hypothetical protein